MKGIIKFRSQLATFEFARVVKALGLPEGSNIEAAEAVEAKMTQSEIKDLRRKIQMQLEAEDPSYKVTNLTEIWV